MEVDIEDAEGEMEVNGDVEVEWLNDLGDFEVTEDGLGVDNEEFFEMAEEFLSLALSTFGKE